MLFLSSHLLGTALVQLPTVSLKPSEEKNPKTSSQCPPLPEAELTTCLFDSYRSVMDVWMDQLLISTEEGCSVRDGCFRAMDKKRWVREKGKMAALGRALWGT